MNEQMMTHEVRHRHSGNGYAIAQIIDHEYCRVVPIGAREIGNQLFLAYAPFLQIETIIETDPKTQEKSTVNRPLNNVVAGLVNEMRVKLTSGQFRVVNTRLVPA